MLCRSDGPNIAYFGHVDVHYSQIDLAVKELLKMGEQPLVIMPEKYSMPKFRISTGFLQKLMLKEIEIAERYVAKENLDGRLVLRQRCLKIVASLG